MTTENNNLFTTEQLEQYRMTIEAVIKNFNDLISRIHYYSGWATNISFGLFGFLIAIIIQFKMALIPFDYSKVIIVFICLGLSVAIGTIIKIRYELFLISYITRKHIDVVFNLFSELKNKIHSKEIEETLTMLNEKGMKELSGISNKKILNIFYMILILLQFLLIYVAIFNIALIVIKYIFIS